MINKINNAICFLFVAATFAMIGLEYATQPHDNERTARHCQVHTASYWDCQK